MHTLSGMPVSCERLLSWCNRRPRCAEAIARSLRDRTPADSPEYPWVLLTLGWCLLVRECLDEANAVLAQAEARLAAMGETVGVLHARHGLLLVGLLHHLSADTPVAWDRLAEEYEALGLSLEVARVRTGQVRCLNMLWRGSEALALGETIRPVIDKVGTEQDRALLDRVIGVAHFLVGNFPQAEQALTDAETSFRQLHLSVELARTWDEQGHVAQYRGDVAAALIIQKRTRHFFTQLDMPLRVAYCDKNLGLTYTRRGQLDPAIAHLLVARGAFSAFGMPLNVAHCTLNLGIAAFYSGLFELALSVWRQAEVIYTEADMPLMVLFSQHNQAEALLRLNQLDAAKLLLTTIIPVAEELGDKNELGEILHVLGEVLQAQGETERAQVVLQQAEHVFDALPNRPAVGRARLAQGWLALSTSKLGEAEQLFQHAALALEERHVYLWRVQYGLGRCAELRGKAHEALLHYEQACTTVADLRSHLAEAHASSALFREAQQIVSATLRLAFAQGEALTVLRVAEQQRALALQQQLQRQPVILPQALQADYEMRRSKLRALALQGAEGPELDAALSAYLEVLLHGRHITVPVAETSLTSRLELEPLRATLGAQYGLDWTVITYLQLDDELIVITLDPEHIQQKLVVLERPLQRLLERSCQPSYRWHSYHDLSFHYGQHTTAWADLVALGALLVPREAQARLAPQHRLLIAPCGLLHSLPWAALRVNEHWLVEQAIIQLIPSLHTWTELVQRPPPGHEALLLGVSHFGGRAADLLSALPSLDLVQRYWPGPAQRLENDAVTRAALREAGATGALRRYGLLHIATHGQLTSGHGMLAHVKLTDDDLLADEVAQLQLGGALVVLAACEGALGELLPGEELVSLSWALLAAGARDVIASLWKLHDLTVLPLLEPLYAALAAGHDAPTALAEAQRACINAEREQPDTLLAKPYVWASLCVIGAGVSVSGTKLTDTEQHS